MELGGDPDPLRESTRSPPLVIDLNEIPSSSDSFDVVRIYHDVPDLPPEPPAAPVVASAPSACGACGLPEADGGRVVVCDGCEGGFHLGCTGMRDLGDGEEWVCGQCTERGVKSRRWPLGFKPKRKPVFVMKITPPRDSDGDGKAGEASITLRKGTLGDISSGDNLFGSSVRYPNLYHAGSGFGFENASVVPICCLEAGFRDVRHHTLMRCKGFGVGSGFPVEHMKSNNSLAFRFQFPHHNPSEILLLVLREYISQRNGVLEEGWHVELKQSNSEIYATYCAPDGAKFDSMFGVASHLGLAPDLKRVESIASNNGNTIKVSETGTEGNIIVSSEQTNDGLPVQFEDFFLLSLGMINSRPTYHGLNQIWPVGYRSCWHDKITGSLFFSDIADGGESGPVFKIRRCSCSSESMPNGSIIFIRQHLQQSACQKGEESGSLNSNLELYGDENIQSILSNSLPPTADEISACVDRNSSKACNIPADTMRLEATSGFVRSGTCSCDKLEFKDEIGEIIVEERSSLLAWKTMSRKLVDAFVDINNRKCTVQLFCKHVESETFSASRDMMDGKCECIFGPLEKFQSLLILRHIQFNVNGHDISSEVMANWWARDRFGLDMQFVQEMMEQLFDVEVCSQYKLLNNRSNYLKLPTFRNGSLLVRGSDGVEMEEEEALDSLFRRSKRARNADHQRCPPAGTVLCKRLLPELAGDCYQIWEVLWRFHEILGLKEAFSLEELEEELASPRLGVANPEKNSEASSLPNLCRTGKVGGQTLSSIGASALTAPGENPWAPVPTEIATLKESEEDKSSSVRRGMCCGVALTKVHSALLTVLMGELQSKVAAIVDPSFDGGDSKPKRGRKRDVHSSLPSTRTKFNMLPINELSWPELARRYILAVLSMDGNSDLLKLLLVKVAKCFDACKVMAGCFAAPLLVLLGWKQMHFCLQRPRSKSLVF